jgi:hypothetical protein
VQLRRQLAGPAAQVDEVTAGDGLAQREQVVKWLTALGVEALVLIRVPPLNWSHGHHAHV